MRKLEHVTLSLDELEAIRLTALDGLYYDRAAKCMEVSRQTSGRVEETTRRKVAGTIVEG